MPWTLSQYGLYQKCPLAFKFRHKDRVPMGPKGPAAARGSFIHEVLESYLKSGSWTEALPQFAVNRAEAMRDDGFEPEVRVAFNDRWEVVPWDSPEAWVRGVIDALLEDPPALHLGEWKTGKVWEDHVYQRELYLIMGLSSRPKTDEASITTIYIDQGHGVTDTLKRENLAEKQVIWMKRAEPMLNDTFFSPRPGQHCLWCDFSQRKGGPCRY
jgi:hypothetical protein